MWAKKVPQMMKFQMSHCPLSKTQRGSGGWVQSSTTFSKSENISGCTVYSTVEVQQKLEIDLEFS